MRFFVLNTCIALSVFVSPVYASEGGPFHSKATNREVGVGGWYGQYHQGKKTASGEYFDAEKLTAAHPSLPFNSWVKVTNLRSGRNVFLRITDRGPYVKGRIIDVSQQAASMLGIKRRGVAKVAVEPVDAPPAEAFLTSSSNNIPSKTAAYPPGYIPPYVMMANAR